MIVLTIFHDLLGKDGKHRLRACSGHKILPKLLLIAIATRRWLLSWAMLYDSEVFRIGALGRSYQ